MRTTGASLGALRPPSAASVACGCSSLPSKRKCTHRATWPAGTTSSGTSRKQQRHKNKEQGRCKRKTCGAIVMHTIHRLKQVRAAGISIWISEPRLATGFLGRESGRWCKGGRRDNEARLALMRSRCSLATLCLLRKGGWIEGESDRGRAIGRERVCDAVIFGLLSLLSLLKAFLWAKLELFGWCLGLQCCSLSCFICRPHLWLLLLHATIDKST